MPTFIDLKSLGKPHEWEEFANNVRQCLRCGEIQRFESFGPSEFSWQTTLEGVEDLCKR